MTGHGVARLLPWAGLEGKPCFLHSDGTGYVSRVADNIESVQLGMAGELLDHAAELLADQKATSDQLRFLLARMNELGVPTTAADPGRLSTMNC